MIHFELTFVDGVRKVPAFLLLHVDIPQEPMNGLGQLNSHMKMNETRSISLTLDKNQVQMDQRPLMSELELLEGGVRKTRHSIAISPRTLSLYSFIIVFFCAIFECLVVHKCKDWLFVGLER